LASDRKSGEKSSEGGKERRTRTYLWHFSGRPKPKEGAFPMGKEKISDTNNVVGKEERVERKPN